MNESDTLKEQLREQLRGHKLEANELLTLAHELADEAGGVRFTVDASHVSRLGLELVSRQETAVSELIKNSYDADAVNVDVIFRNTDAPGGALEIIDSGTGMSEQQLRDGFMRLSTKQKVDQPISPKYSRQRAGRKGIGRFATQRLGRKLQLKTQQDGESRSLGISIDWNQFEAGRDLYQISNQIVEAEPIATPGTTLLIEDLRDAWTEAQIRRAYRYVSELIQPFPLDRKSAALDPSKDPGFKVNFFKETGGDLVTIVTEESAIFSHAIAKISASILEDGTAKVSVESSRYKVDYIDKHLADDARLKGQVDSNSSTYPLIPGVHLSAHYFIQEEMPSGTKGMVREILTNTGGIRVYRNGFRVLPYGETFDDWLGLQRSSALRQVLPPHHNTNFLGFVELIDPNGEVFEETASREGLLDNEAFRQLQDFVYRALITGVLEVARARGKKLFASDPKKKDGSDRASAKERAESAATQLRELAEESRGSGGEPTEAADKLSVLADEVDALGDESRSLLEEVGMLRVLASLGLTIGEFTHEVRHILLALSASVDGLSHGDSESNQASIAGHLSLLRGYMRYFDDAVSHNVDRSLQPLEMRDVVNDFVEFIRPSLQRQNVSLDVTFDGYDLFVRPMHRSEWASILLNLYTNSLKALQRSGSSGKIKIQSGFDGGSIYVNFSDNGDGISESNREKIFDAFFTTSAPGSALASHADQLVGSGLGLKIVRDIVEAADGEIDIVEAPQGYATCFSVRVPRATEEQIGEARY